MKVRAYLALMAAAILIPDGVFSAMSLKTLLDAQREAAFRVMQETARLTSLAIDRELDTAQAVLHTISISPQLAAGDLATFSQQLHTTTNRTNTWGLLLDENGQQLCNTLVPYGQPLPPPEAASRVKAVLAAGAPQVSNLLLGPLTKQLLAVVDMPVTVPTGRQYVISQVFPAQYFEKAFSALENRPGWIVGIFDREGHTVARNVHMDGMIGQPPKQNLLDAILAERKGVFRNQSRENLELYTVLARSPISGWTVAVGVPVDEIESAARNAVVVSAAGLLAALSCGAIFAAVFARRLVSSIRSAGRSAATLGRGDIPYRLHSAIDELDALHAAQAEAGRLLTNERESRVRAQAERARLLESEQAARKVIEEERAKNLLNAQKARRMAERQNQLKDQFLAMLGHELRNPLSAIGGAVTILDLPHASQRQRDHAHEILIRQTGHLSRIVDDLLDIGRVTSGKLVLVRHPLDFSEVALSCLGALQTTGRTRQHHITVEASSVWVEADRTRLEQIINNLLINAVKYTPPGGRIAVTVAREDKQAVFRTEDTGIGIDQELLPHLFELFVQGEASVDRSEGGMGIGLALVSRLVAMHDGTIAATSPGTGLGSVFTVRLPISEQPVASAPPADEPAGRAGLSTVLLIDDNEDARQMMEDVLRLSGYEVLSAADGPSGLSLARQSLPDVAIVDIGLPGMDGLQVARQLQAVPETQQIRLIALTGYGQENDRQRSLQAGFERHFAKPVDLATLMEAINETPVNRD